MTVMGAQPPFSQSVLHGGFLPCADVSSPICAPLPATPTLPACLFNGMLLGSPLRLAPMPLQRAL